MTGSAMQLYNGILLITTFFSCRLVYGTYQSYLVFKDVWSAVGTHPDLSQLEAKEAGDLMRFAVEGSTVPLWLAVVYLASNTTLNSLNCYWFYKMIQALSKRFQTTETGLPEEKARGKASGFITAPEPRKRNAMALGPSTELDVVI